jgi:hypothetical protein
MTIRCKTAATGFISSTGMPAQGELFPVLEHVGDRGAE